MIIWPRSTRNSCKLWSIMRPFFSSRSLFMKIIGFFIKSSSTPSLLGVVKEFFFLLISRSVLDTIYLSLTSRYVAQSFKVAVIKSDPEALANYRDIFYSSLILQKAVANLLCSFQDLSVVLDTIDCNILLLILENH